MRGPGLFSEIRKKGKDLLRKDYSYDQKITFSSPTKTGVGLTTNAVKKGGLYIGDIASQYKYKNTTFDVKVDTESNVSSTVTLEEFLPFTKAVGTLKLPDNSSGKLEVQYFHDHASVAGAVGLKQSPIVDLSATVGSQGIAFGAEAAFDTSSGTFTKYNAGLSLKKPDYIVSILLADKGDTLRACYVHHLSELDSLTSVKTKLNNGRKFGALFQHQLRPNNVLTISGEFDTKSLDKKPRFGLALALKP
ncbi:unnamed protein product [Spirodela intermedia]|uniref:Uncharacterized protein n=1 Tax=Spirodela intermedia TaxID=51605 RepID=A0A7I8LMV0_SPIIN|nr:unnamed protein product [Spirodela intermedia]